MRKATTIIATLILGGWLLSNCGASGMEDAANTGNGGADDREYPGAAQDGSAYADVTTESDTIAEEEEMDFDFQAPQASEHYVYIAATARDSVVRIDAETLDIQLIPVGGRPTRVATLPDGDVALVINSGTNDLSIIRSTEDSDEVTTLQTLPYLNAIAISPDGAHAILYYNHQQAAEDDPVGDLQTVLLVSMVDGEERVSRISTGFHTTKIFYHESLAIAYLVTNDGIGVLDLESAEDGDITTIVPLSDDIMEDPELREVVVTEDGRYALVRHQGSDSFRVVDLETGELVPVQLPGVATDVDLIPGTHRALLVLRAEEQAFVANLDDLEADDGLTAIDITGTQAGAAVVTRDGARAVLYSTVGGSKAVSILNLGQQPYGLSAYPVQKTVVGVDVSLQGSTAVIFHEAQGATDGDSDTERTVAQANGFTLLQMESGYRKMIQTEDPWTRHIFIADNEQDARLYVLTPDPFNVDHVLQSVDLSTMIRERISMAAYPESMVYVPTSGKLAVSQEHINGRISFVDVGTDEVYSVTGYELNGMIH